MFAVGKCAFAVMSKEHLRVPLVSAHRNWKRWVAPTLRELKKRKDKMGPQPIPHRSAFLEWNYHAELYAFGKRLNEEFRPEALQSALTHQSYIAQEEAHQRELGIEDPQLGLKDNKELADQGEKLMIRYIQRYLRTALPRFPEEGIQSIRSFLMCDDILGNISTHIGTKDLILSSDHPAGIATLAVTFKAVVGALALSSGTAQAETFVRDLVIAQLADRDVNELWPIAEPTATLAAIMRREGRGEPEARLVNEAGRNTILAVYQVAVYVDRQYMGIGSGESVPVAKEMAARDALKRLFRTAENMRPIPFDLAAVAGGDENVSMSLWTTASVE